MLKPSLKIQEQVPLAPFTTLGIGGPARYFCVAGNEAEVEEGARFAREKGLPLFLLGGGSNVLVSDAGFEGVVMQIGTIMPTQERVDGESILLEVGAGEDWNEVVLHAVERGYAGIECLAGIPGDVGGTPVQNVGAYGQEVAETIVRVRVFDLEARRFRDLDHTDCGFAYRKSIFNSSERGRYIVTAVTYRLRPGGEPALRYADVKHHFAIRLEQGEVPSLREVYDAVRAIREKKGMLAGQGGRDGRSAGSFFKNPVIPLAQVEKVARQAGCAAADVPIFPLNDGPAKGGMVKLAGAWLMERAGFHKGFAMGNAAISSRHTLALVNLGGATAAEMIALRDAVMEGVRGKFSIVLEQEPVLLGFRLRGC